METYKDTIEVDFSEVEISDEVVMDTMYMDIYPKETLANGVTTGLMKNIVTLPWDSKVLADAVFTILNTDMEKGTKVKRLISPGYILHARMTDDKYVFGITKVSPRFD
jgi:hypothetical protein